MDRARTAARKRQPSPRRLESKPSFRCRRFRACRFFPHDSFQEPDWALFIRGPSSKKSLVLASGRTVLGDHVCVAVHSTRQKSSSLSHHAAKIPARHVMPHPDAASFCSKQCHSAKRSRIRQARLPARDDERGRDFCREIGSLKSRNFFVVYKGRGLRVIRTPRVPFGDERPEGMS